MEEYEETERVVVGTEWLEGAVPGACVGAVAAAWIVGGALAGAAAGSTCPKYAEVVVKKTRVVEVDVKVFKRWALGPRPE